MTEYPLQNGGSRPCYFNASAIPLAHALIAFQSRKSPTGALTLVQELVRKIHFGFILHKISKVLSAGTGVLEVIPSESPVFPSHYR